MLKEQQESDRRRTQEAAETAAHEQAYLYPVLKYYRTGANHYVQMGEDWSWNQPSIKR